MNAIEKLAARILKEFPSATATLDRPPHRMGVWWLDVQKGNCALHVAWSSAKGFGVSSPEATGYGAGHDEVFPDFNSAWERVRSLLRSGRRTRASIALRLRGVRQSKQLSQANLAKRMKIQQAALSKLERRKDMLVSTLGEMVKALGGELKITARFNDREVRLR